MDNKNRCLRGRGGTLRISGYYENGKGRLITSSCSLPFRLLSLTVLHRPQDMRRVTNLSVGASLSFRTSSWMKASCVRVVPRGLHYMYRSFHSEKRMKLSVHASCTATSVALVGYRSVNVRSNQQNVHDGLRTHVYQESQAEHGFWNLFAFRSRRNNICKRNTLFRPWKYMFRMFRVFRKRNSVYFGDEIVSREQHDRVL